ncbi:MAG: glycosyltransferase family 4 protein [Planctomycetales bacterium]|nr:glycosyltransferase family 4 protein [Planctomycetales bacterium]
MSTPTLKSSQPRVGYVVKRYPRFSETFIVNEILAHEAVGLAMHIFSLRPCNDTHFQDRISRVKAPLHLLKSASCKATEFWDRVKRATERFPSLWKMLETEQHVDAATWLQVIELAEAVQDQDIHHLHAHFATLSTEVARLASQLANITYSFTAHAKDIFHESVCETDLRRKFRDAAAIVTVSEFNLDNLRSRFPAAADRIHRVYNGLDLENLPFAEPESRQPRIIAVGRLVEKKGFGDLIQACRILRDRGQQFTCDIIGTGEQEAELRRLVEELQLHATVQLIGPQSRAIVAQRVQEAAVMAAPCVVGDDGNRDGLPTVLLEAMALGTPCVSTDVTGIPEIMEHGRTGMVARQRDAQSLADNLQHVLDDVQLQHTLALQARQLIDAEFDSAVTSARLREIFATCFRAGRAVNHPPSPIGAANDIIPAEMQESL